ncbi:hypothetical protein M9H77_04531 [Catharanthus roseus]|uniref:Uncharacterized protein n=1 Tax=Catharanthus roseus TaxID=4058 RepID=A0ACC0CE97_CATRO|nr:hypothetical protein M9H77_04531 [Catharanthus roseus]
MEIKKQFIIIQDSMGFATSQRKKLLLSSHLPGSWWAYHELGIAKPCQDGDGHQGFKISLMKTFFSLRRFYSICKHKYYFSNFNFCSSLSSFFPNSFTITLDILIFSLKSTNFKLQYTKIRLLKLKEEKMVRPDGHRGDDNLDPLTDRTDRVEGALGSSAQPPHIPISSRPPLLSHHPHTPVPYDIYGSSHPPSQPLPALYDPYVHALSVHPHIPYRSIVQEPMNEFSGPGRKLGAKFQDQMVGAVPTDSSYNTHECIATDYGISSSDPFGLDPEPAMVGSLHISREDVGMVHGDSDDDDDVDDDDDGAEAGGEEKPITVAPVAPTSSSGSRPCPRKGKGLTGSFILVMSKIVGKKAKSSDWELTGPTDGGPIDPELIQLYGGHVAGRIWLGQERSILKSRSRYIALQRGGSRTTTVFTCHLMITVIQSDLGIMYTGGGINGQELFDVATDPHGRLSSSDRDAFYIQFLLGSSLFTDKSSNVVPAKLWPLVKNVRSCRGFAWVLRRLRICIGTLVRPLVWMRRNWPDTGHYLSNSNFLWYSGSSISFINFCQEPLMNRVATSSSLTISVNLASTF